MADNDWAPDACTLPTAQRPVRLAEFDDLFASVRELRRSRPALLDLVIPSAAETAARDLAERESACCSFFGFDFLREGERVVMRIGVPPEYIDVLDAVEARVTSASTDR
jgi:hypothetical protein